MRQLSEILRPLAGSAAGLDAPAPPRRGEAPHRLLRPHGGGGPLEHRRALSCGDLRRSVGRLELIISCEVLAKRFRNLSIKGVL